LLLENGVTQGNVALVLSGWRFLGLYDSEGRTNRNILERLRNTQERTAALREIVETYYSDVVSQTNLENATVKDIDYFFQYQGVKASMSGKMARFFFWLAQEAGYKLGEQVLPTPSRSALTPPTGHQVARTPDEEREDADESDENIYERELLEILMEKVRYSKEIPSTEVLNYMKELIASVKRQKP